MYVPLLKNRTVEVSVLQQLNKLGIFGERVLPLIELVQEKTRSNNKKTFLEELGELLESSPGTTLFLDFFKSTKLRGTTDSIREYITQTVRQPDFCIQQFKLLEPFNRQVIPVISYLSENIAFDRIRYENTIYKSLFGRVAFRIKVQEFDKVFNFLEPLIEKKDFIIFDIESTSPVSPVLKKYYSRISDCRKRTGFQSIVVNAHRPAALSNKDMADGEPIADIDNSLRELYNTSLMSKFNGFGDYAGISAALPTTGGTISPVGIYYSYENNFFVSYRARVGTLSEFPDYIAPNIINSEYWAEYNEKHHSMCPGCHEIVDILEGKKSGKNQAQWKMITMLHYIYTIHEMNP